MKSIAMEQLAAYATPLRIPISDNRESRHWILRHDAPLPADLSLESESVSLTIVADSAVRSARVGRGLSADLEEAHRPLVELVAIDDQCLIVVVSTVKLEKDDGHEYLVAASAVLSVLDKRLVVHEIQGIPRRYWRLLLGEASV